MYCSKCGTKNDLNSKFCSKCGAELDNNMELLDNVDDKKLKCIKTISILALIFSFILPPVGLILSIIGIIKYSKYSKEKSIKFNYLIFNIISIIVSAFITFMIVLFLIIFTIVYTVFKSQDDILKSTWECTISPYSSTYVVTARFDSNEFMWAKYGDESDNQLRGDYRILSRKSENGENEYKIKFSPNYYISSGIESDNYSRNVTMTIEFDETSATITSENSTRYYCVRK